jgi:flagellar hook-length control protein FliK
MEIMQNAMTFQEVASLALSQSGRASASVARSADSGGRFAELLQGKQPSREEAVQQTEGEVGQPPTSGGAGLLRLQNSYGSPASAAGDTEVSQSAAETQSAGAPAELTPKTTPSVGATRLAPGADSAPAATAAATRPTGDTGVGESGVAVAPDPAKGSNQVKMLSDLQRNSLAAGAQETTTALTDAQQGRGVTLATAAEVKKAFMPTPGKTQGSDRGEVRSIPVRTGLAAEAQETAALSVAAQLGMAAFPQVTAQVALGTPTDTLSGVMEAGAAKGSVQVPMGQNPGMQYVEAAPMGAVAMTASGAEQIPKPVAKEAPFVGTQAAKGQLAVPQATAPQAAVQPGSVEQAAAPAAPAAVNQAAAGEVASSTQARVKEVAPQETRFQETATILPFPASDAKGRPFTAARPVSTLGTEPRQTPDSQAGNGRTEEVAPQTQPGLAVSGEQLAGVKVSMVQQGPGMVSDALDSNRAASPATVTDGLQNAGAKGEPIKPQATGGAPERAQQAVAASGGQIQGAALAEPGGAFGLQQGSVTPQEDGTTPNSQAAQLVTDSKGPRAAMSFHGTYAAGRSVVAEQPDSKAAAPVEDAAGTGAPVVGGAKFVPSQGSAGQGSAGDPGKKGHSEQKAQNVETTPLQAQGIGLGGATAAEAPQQAEAKPAVAKSALHESILAQIKDGVVTHDAKGNGQMSIRLNPGELGELKIQIRMDDNRLRVEVQADNRMVKDLLMGNLDSLKESLTAKNFSMEGFDVSTGSGGGFNSPLPEQKGSPQQQSFLRSARAGAYPDQGEETRVNYLTGEANNLLDVRF